MRPTSLSANSLPTLFLLLLLFRPGLQVPLRSQVTTQLPLTMKTTLNCSVIIQEIKQKLQVPSVDHPDFTFKVLLGNESLLRRNLCVFLKANKALTNLEGKMNIKKNLEILESCLPNATTTPKGNPIYIKDNNVDDFRVKLYYYLNILSEKVGSTVISKTLYPTPSSVPSHHRAMDC